MALESQRDSEALNFLCFVSFFQEKEMKAHPGVG